MELQYKVETYQYEWDINNGELPTKLNIIEGEKQIVDLAIYAYPGTKFSINDSAVPIIIGPSGIFTWKLLQNEGYINSIKFINFPYEINDLSSVSSEAENLIRYNQVNMLVTYGYYI